MILSIFALFAAAASVCHAADTDDRSTPAPDINVDFLDTRYLKGRKVGSRGKVGKSKAGKSKAGKGKEKKSQMKDKESSSNKEESERGDYGEGLFGSTAGGQDTGTWDLYLQYGYEQNAGSGAIIKCAKTGGTSGVTDVKCSETNGFFKISVTAIKPLGNTNDAANYFLDKEGSNELINTNVWVSDSNVVVGHVGVPSKLNFAVVVDLEFTGTHIIGGTPEHWKLDGFRIGMGNYGTFNCCHNWWVGHHTCDLGGVLGDHRLSCYGEEKMRFKAATRSVNNSQRNLIQTWDGKVTAY